MGLYTNAVKGLSRAPYIEQVKIYLMNAGVSEVLSDKEQAKVQRVQRFLPAGQCADEIVAERQPARRRA